MASYQYTWDVSLGSSPLSNENKKAQISHAFTPSILDPKGTLALDLQIELRVFVDALCEMHG